ncbi:MAG: tyrosine-type recombinase/integrase [Paludibacter sp.]
MATITLSLSEKSNEKGNSEILIRFSASQSQRYRVKSGLFISENRWTKKNEISIPKIETEERKQLILLTSKLESLKNHILTQYEQSDRTAIDKSWLSTVIDKFHFPEKYISTKQGFFDLFDDYIHKRKLSAGRLRAVKVVFRSLKRYELYKQKSDSSFLLDYDKFDENLLLDIESFFKSEPEVFEKYPDIYEIIKESRVPKQRGQNTLNDMFGKLRTFFIWLVENEKIDINPFNKFPIGECVYGTPYYITVAERNQLYAKNMKSVPQLAVQRDIFVLQCLIGCRVGDYFKMKMSNIINGAIEYIAGKTKDGNPITVRVPLNSNALEIIERYKDSSRESLMPFSSEQKYNEDIKLIFGFAQLNRMVTVLNPTTREEEKRPLNEIASSHLARRCFIGNLYKQVKDPNLVGSLSGHRNGSKAFARYRDIDDEMKIDLVNLLL